MQVLFLKLPQITWDDENKILVFGMQQYYQLWSTGKICPGKSDLEELKEKENKKKTVEVFVVGFFFRLRFLH